MGIIGRYQVQDNISFLYIGIDKLKMIATNFRRLGQKSRKKITKGFQHLSS